MAQRIDLLALHEIAMASAVPKPMPALAAVPEWLPLDFGVSGLICLSWVSWSTTLAGQWFSRPYWVTLGRRADD